MMDYIYDIECYPNCFLLCIKEHRGRTWLFEISDRRHDGYALFQTLVTLQFTNSRMVGFNNIGYDYPMIHNIIMNRGNVSNSSLHALSVSIINDHSNRYVIWPSDRFITQIDLYKIHHFDNKSRRTSLKALEFNMRSDNIKDLPFDPMKPLTDQQIDELRIYNQHDVTETEEFLEFTYPAIKFREELSVKYGKDFLNHNDTKIGKDYFGMVLNKSGIPTKINGVLNQTRRDRIVINDIIFPYIKFERPEFNEVLNFFRQQVVTKKDPKGFLELKGIFKGIHCEVDGFQFDFGSGGIHGSVKTTIIKSSPTHKLMDVDVASYYPNLGIKNKLYPAHLSEKFCELNLEVFNERKTHDKKSPINGMLKLALNGVYGDSNNRYSFFYDPQYTLSITINGQLLLCMLAEQLMKIPGLTLVQMNTDGLTYLCPNEFIEHSRSIQKWWEGLTKLELEEVPYNRMFVRDVNSYIAEKEDGSLKRIGAYAYVRAAEDPATREIAWHKDHGALVIAKAAEAALVRGVNIETFIKSHTDLHDFVKRAKVNRNSYLEIEQELKWGDTVLSKKTEKIDQRIVRYYPSVLGGRLKKVMPPTDKQQQAWLQGDHYRHKNTGEYKVVGHGKKPPSGMYEPVLNPSPKKPDNVTSIEAGQTVKLCNDIAEFTFKDLDYDYYIKETRKIVDPLFGTTI